MGLGFAWFENITYYMRASQDGVGPMLALAWVRGVLHGAGGHATFTGLTGLGFGMFRALRQHPARWFVPPAALATAMFAGQVIVGSCVSLTVTVKAQVAVLLAPSVTLKVFVVVPTGNEDPEGKPEVWIVVGLEQLSVPTGVA